MDLEVSRQMMMYKCNNCNHIFDEPIIEHDDPSPSGVSLPSGYYEYWYCPKCGSDDVEEVMDGDS